MAAQTRLAKWYIHRNTNEEGRNLKGPPTLDEKLHEIDDCWEENLSSFVMSPQLVIQYKVVNPEDMQKGNAN